MSFTYTKWQCAFKECSLSWNFVELSNGKPPRHNIDGDNTKDVCPGVELTARKVTIEDTSK